MSRRLFALGIVASLTLASGTHLKGAGGGISTLFTGLFGPGPGPTDPSGTRMTVVRVNDNGAVVGQYAPTGATYQKAYLWTGGFDGEFTDLGTLGGPSATVVDVNNARVAAGNSEEYAGGPSRAFIWSRTGGTSDLGTLGGPDAVAADINNSNWVVGYSSGSRFPGERLPFVWTPGEGMSLLDSATSPDVAELPHGDRFGEARQINDNGLVVGYETVRAGDVNDVELWVYHAWVWKPSMASGRLTFAPEDIFGGVSNPARIEYSIADRVTNSGWIMGRTKHSAFPGAEDLRNTEANGRYDWIRSPEGTLYGAAFTDLNERWATYTGGVIPDDDKTHGWVFDLVTGTRTDIGRVDLVIGPHGEQDLPFFLLEDGGVIGHTADDDGFTIHAFHWSAATGRISIDNPEPNLATLALRQGGGVVVGVTEDNFGNLHLFAWNGVFQNLGVGLGDNPFTLQVGGNGMFAATSGDNPDLGTDWMKVFYQGPPPISATRRASKDSFLRSGASDRNEGANPVLRIQAAGDNRAVVGFDLTGIDVSSVTSARLVLTIADNGNNWGNGQRTVNAHPLSADFAEGNGRDAGLPPAQSTRGSGSGVTWKCATDTQISNAQPNCGAPWNGGTFGAATATPVTHANFQSGPVQWNVTADVKAGRTAWVIKKTNEGAAGEMGYYSREGALQSSNQTLAPTLILRFN